MTIDGRSSQIIDQPEGATVGHWAGYEIRSAFQPIYAFSKGRLQVCAFEALARPLLGRDMIAAGPFFSQLGQSELVEAEAVCRNVHLKNAARFLGRDATLFVNFDPRAFADTASVRTLFAEMETTLVETGLDPGNIVCEITERTGGAEDWLRAFVGSLRRAGFRIAVDDYGAQASDARRVDQLEPDIVKFDGAWVTRLMRTTGGALLLKMLVEDFRMRGIGTLFEGLEQPQQVEIAESCGVEMAQGYALAYPQIVPADFSGYLGGVGAVDIKRAKAAGGRSAA